MDLTEIAKKWGNTKPTPDEWANMSDDEAAALLRRDIWGNYAYRGYYTDSDELLEKCKKAVHTVRNFKFSNPKYKIVTQYKHDLTIDAGGPWYITWDLKIVCDDVQVKYTGPSDMWGTFGLFKQWSVSPSEYRAAMPHIGKHNIALRKSELTQLWEAMKAAIPETVAKHTKSGKVEDKAVTKFAEIIEKLGNGASLELVKVLLKYHNEARNSEIEDFMLSLRRNGATVSQMDDVKVQAAWDLASVKKIMKS